MPFDGIKPSAKTKLKRYVIYDQECHEDKKDDLAVIQSDGLVALIKELHQTDSLTDAFISDALELTAIRTDKGEHALLHTLQPIKLESDREFETFNGSVFWAYKSHMGRLIIASSDPDWIEALEGETPQETLGDAWDNQRMSAA